MKNRRLVGPPPERGDGCGRRVIHDLDGDARIRKDGAEQTTPQGRDVRRDGVYAAIGDHWPLDIGASRPAPHWTGIPMSVSGFDYWPSSCDGSWGEIGEGPVDPLKPNEKCPHDFNTAVDGQDGCR
jgi:hypothetical protein